jgi:hypothetical protein
MDIATLESILSTFENDPTLEIETNLIRRLSVIDLIEFAEGHNRAYSPHTDFAAVDGRLADFKKKLLTINARIFDRLRIQIREGAVTPEALRREFDRYTDYSAEQKGTKHVGSDALDALFDAVLELDPYPRYTPPTEPNMVVYYPTPARAVLDMVDNAVLKPDDVFYDLGSGVGRVVILVNLASGAKAKGVEFNPDLHQYACDYADKLGLTDVEFINADAQKVDYSDGTVFFMYTPFTGELMQAVLRQLWQTAQKHPIKVCAFGPCTSTLADQKWLRSDAENVYNANAITIFHSLPRDGTE